MSSLLKDELNKTTPRTLTSSRSQHSSLLNQYTSPQNSLKETKKSPLISSINPSVEITRSPITVTPRLHTSSNYSSSLLHRSPYSYKSSLLDINESRFRQEQEKRQEEWDKMHIEHDSMVSKLILEQDNFNKQIDDTMREKDVADQRLKNLQLDNLNLHRAALEKNREFNDLQETMNLKMSDAYNNLNDKNVNFHQSSKFKTDNQYKNNEGYYELMKNEHENVNSSNSLFEKICSMENEYEKQVLQWKQVSADVKKQGEVKIAEIHQMSNLKIAEFNNRNYEHEQGQRRNMEDNDNIIHNLTKIQEDHGYVKDLLSNELILLKEELTDVNNEALCLEKQIENEKNIIAIEGARFNKLLTISEKNKANLVSINTAHMDNLDKTTTETNNRINDHNSMFNMNMEKLNQQHQSLDQDDLQKTNFHSDLAENMKRKIAEQTSDINNSSMSKLSLEGEGKDLMNRIRIQQNDHEKEIELITQGTEKLVGDKDDTIYQLSDNINKIRTDLTRNLEEIHKEVAEKNYVTDYLLSHRVLPHQGDLYHETLKNDM